MPVLNTNALIDERVAALRKAHVDARCPRATLNLSGGIDSAVMACLLVLALGPDNVTLDHTNMSTSHSQTHRAATLAKALKAKMANGNFGEIFNAIMAELGRSLEAAGFDRDEIDARCEKDPTILGSIRSCLRAPLGRAYNRLTGGGLYAGTGNECEDGFLRYYQKGGDGEVDNNPIAMLSKGEVYQLAWALGYWMGAEVQAALLPIIGATPSADLWGIGDAHSDESELANWLGAPFTYSRISVETGEYVKVGTIERVSRFLDLPAVVGEGTAGSDRIKHDLFDDEGTHMPSLVTAALKSGYFQGFTPAQVEALLKGARKAEAATRHKLNPNIPTYGDRASLVEDGILTNDLPNI